MSDPHDVLRDSAQEIAKAQRLLLSVARAAKRLELHPETVRRWIRSGKLPAIRYPSGHFKIEAAVVEQIRTTLHDTALHP